MKDSKNAYYFMFIQGRPVLADILHPLFCRIPSRLVLGVFLLILPSISLGQLLHTNTNMLPVTGLENIYVGQEVKVKPVFFISPSVIICKSNATILYVNGVIQEDIIFAENNVVAIFPITSGEKPKTKTEIVGKKQHKITIADEPQILFTSSLPIVPWYNNNPLKYKVIGSIAATVPVVNKYLSSKNIKTLSCLYPSIAALLLLSAEEKSSSLYCASNVSISFGKNVTDFSSRPPPAQCLS